MSYLDPLDAFPRARDAATKAIELDPSLAEAHASLAYYNLYHAWNWAESETEFKRAIELNPNYATAHESDLLAMGRMSKPGPRSTEPANSTPCLSSSALTSDSITFIGMTTMGQ